MIAHKGQRGQVLHNALIEKPASIETFRILQAPFPIRITRYLPIDYQV